MANWYKLGYIVLLSVLSCQVNAISWKGIVQRLVGAGRSYFYLAVHIPTESINRPNRITHILASSTDFSRPPIYPRFSLASLPLPHLGRNYFPPITRQQLEEIKNVPNEELRQACEIIRFDPSRSSGKTDRVKHVISQGQYKTHNYRQVDSLPDIALLNFIELQSIPGYFHFHDSSERFFGNPSEGGMSIEHYLRMPENDRIARSLSFTYYQLHQHVTATHSAESGLQELMESDSYTLHHFSGSEQNIKATEGVPYYFTLSEHGNVRMLRSEEVPQMNIMVINGVHIPIWDQGFGYSIALVPISLASKLKFVTPDVADEYNSVMKESGYKRDDGASGGGGAAATVAGLFGFTQQEPFPFTKPEMKRPGEIFADTLKGADNSGNELKAAMLILITLWFQQKSI